MRTIVFFLFYPIIIFSQEKAGIYNISFSISPNLLQEYRDQTNKGISSNGIYNPPISSNLNYSASKVQIAEFLHDSVRIAIEKMVGVVLNSKASCIFLLNKKNEPISSSGFWNNIKGLPINSLRNAISFYEENLYVSVNVRFYGYNVSLPSFFGVQKGYIQPKVSIRIKAYNVERTKIFNRKIRYSNFPKLNNFQVSGFETNTKVIRQEILSSDMIFSMLKETMIAYKKKYLNQE